MLNRFFEEQERAVVDSVMTSRHAARAYLPKKVSRKDIEEILELASRAPSGSNVQPWRVTVVTGESKARLSRAILVLSEDASRAHERQEEYPYYPHSWVSPYLERRRKVGWDLYNLLGLARDNKAGMQAQHARNYQFFDAPVGLIFTMDRVMSSGSLLDFGMFLQNIMLAARARNIASCPQAALNEYHRTVFEVLQLPESEMMVCVMSLGYPDLNKIENTLVSERAGVAEFARFLD